MAAEFDPYRNWLGIKSDERPPNHYDLLGVKLFEDRAELIDQASIKRIDLLQDISSGSAHLDSTQRILNEVSVARLCLLNKYKRERYELTVKKKMAGLESAEERIARLSKAEPNIAPPTPVPLQSLEDVSFESVVAPQPKSPSRLSTQRKSGFPLAKTLLIWAALIAFVVGTLGGAYLFVAPKIKAEFAREAADEATYLESRLAHQTAAEQPDNEQSVEESSNTPGKTLTPLLAPLVSETNKENNVIEERSERDDPDPKPDPVNVAQPEAKPKPKTNTKQTTARVIARYEATIGQPTIGQPDTVESPIKQGWKGNDDPDETNIDEGVFDDQKPAWRNGDRRYDKTDFRFNLTDDDYQDMWNRGWRLEVVAKPVSGSYKIGWNGSKQSKFKDEKPLQATVVFSAGKNSSVRIGGSSTKDKIDFENGFVKVVLEGKPRSKNFNFSVFEVKRKNEIQIHSSKNEKLKSGSQQGRVTWATARGQDRKTDKERETEASIQVRKVELSIPKQPKQ